MSSQKSVRQKLLIQVPKNSKFSKKQTLCRSCIKNSFYLYIIIYKKLLKINLYYVRINRII